MPLDQPGKFFPSVKPWAALDAEGRALRVIRIVFGCSLAGGLLFLVFIAIRGVFLSVTVGQIVDCVAVIPFLILLAWCVGCMFILRRVHSPISPEEAVPQPKYTPQQAIVERDRALATIIRAEGGERMRTVLDAACGHGTQSLGLTALGYEVTSSDVTHDKACLTQRFAGGFGISLPVSVADMRHLHDHHRRAFDVVLACNNSISSLLSDSDILAAFRQFHACTAPGGICLVCENTAAQLNESPKSPDVHEHAGVRYIFVDIKEPAPKPPLYETKSYLITHQEGKEPFVTLFRTTCYPVSIDTLTTLMEQAGFSSVHRVDDTSFPGMIVGHKPAS